MEVKHIQITVQLPTAQVNMNTLIQTYRDCVKTSTKKPSVITCFEFKLFVLENFSVQLRAHLQNCFVRARGIRKIESLEANVPSQLIRPEFSHCADQRFSVKVFKNLPSSPH